MFIRFIIFRFNWYECEYSKTKKKKKKIVLGASQCFLLTITLASVFSLPYYRPRGTVRWPHPVNSSYVISCNTSVHYDNKNRNFFFSFFWSYIKIYNKYVLFFRFFKSIFNRIFLKKNINYYYYQISLKFYEIIIIVQLSSICFRFIYERMYVAAYNEVHIYNAWYNAPSLLVSAQLHVPLHSSKTL